MNAAEDELAARNRTSAPAALRNRSPSSAVRSSVERAEAPLRERRQRSARARHHGELAKASRYRRRDFRAGRGFRSSPNAIPPLVLEAATTATFDARRASTSCARRSTTRQATAAEANSAAGRRRSCACRSAVSSATVRFACNQFDNALGDRMTHQTRNVRGPDVALAVSAARCGICPSDSHSET